MHVARCPAPLLVGLFGLAVLHGPGVARADRDAAATHLDGSGPAPGAATPAANGEAGATIGNALAQASLLEGIRQFRAEHYDDSLRLFRLVATEHQPPDIGFYLGMALHKLGRHVEALTAFRAAQRAGLHEPVADYYAALSCYRLGMWARARIEFSALINTAGLPTPGHGDAGMPPLGPRLLGGARSFLASIPNVPSGLEGTPDPAADNWLRRFDSARAQADSALTAEHPDAALEWLLEAARIVEGLPERGERTERIAELRAAVTRLRGKLSGPAVDVDLRPIAILTGAP